MQKEQYVSCINAKGYNFSAEGLLLLLILEQQKMINELIVKLSDIKMIRVAEMDLSQILSSAQPQ